MTETPKNKLSAKTRKRIIIWASGVIAFLVAFLLVLDLFLPRIVDMVAVQGKIKELASSKTGGKVDFEELELSIVPRPEIIVRKASFDLPGTTGGTLDYVEIYPRVLPLFLGDIQVAKLVMRSPVFSVDVSGKPEKQKEKKEQASAELVKKYITPLLKPMALGVSGFVVEIDDGEIDLVEKGTTVYSFRDVDALITSPEGIAEFEITYTSNISDKIRVTGQLSPDRSIFRGRFDIKRVKPKYLIDHYFPNISGQVPDKEFDLTCDFEAADPKIFVKNLSVMWEESSLVDIDAEMDLSGERPVIHMTSGTARVVLDELYRDISGIKALSRGIKELRSVDGNVELTVNTIDGPMFEPWNWDFAITGALKDVKADLAFLPSHVTVSTGNITAVPQKISLKDLRTAMSDTSLNVSASFTDYVKGLRDVELAFNGQIGHETSVWINNVIDIPERFSIRKSLSITRALMRWQKGLRITFDTDLSVSEGPKLQVEGTYQPDRFNIKRLHLKDNDTDAVMALDIKKRDVTFTFSGTVTGRTVSTIIAVDQPHEGSIQGDVTVQFPFDRPARLKATGSLKGENLLVPGREEAPCVINRASIDATGNVISVTSSEVLLGEKLSSVTGYVKGADEGLVIDADVSSAGITWDDLDRLLFGEDDEEAGEEDTSDDLTVSGSIRARADSFSYDKYTWHDVRGGISFVDDNVDIDITDAVICNVTMPGEFDVKGSDMRFDFDLNAKEQDLKNTLICFFGQDYHVTGTFDLAGKLTSKGKGGELLKHLNGNINFIAKDGTIYRSPTFSKIFKLINVTEVFRGNYSDIAQKGFPYNSTTIKADVVNGKLLYREMVMDGSTMEMVGKGEVDLATDEMNITFLVAPLKTVDAVVKVIPILKNITAGNLITVAMKVEGTFGDPKVRIVSSSMVGEGLVGMMKRTFQLPFKIFTPDTTDDKEHEEQLQSQ